MEQVVEVAKGLRKANTIGKFVQTKLGPTPFIVEVGCVLSPEISIANRSADVLCFDPSVTASGHKGTIPTLMWNRTDSFGHNGFLVQARPLDFYWEEYRFPIDLLICNPKEYARIILGGRRIIFESRFIAIRQFPDTFQQQITSAILPEFKAIPDCAEYLMFENTTF